MVEDMPDLVHYGVVDDHYASFEWSEGGMIHAHIAFWIVGAPRIDKIEVPREKDDASAEKTYVVIDVVPEGSLVVPHTAAADQLAAFWDRVFTEFNVAKAMVAEDKRAQALPGPAWEGLSALAPQVGVRQELGSAEERKVRSPESIS